MKVENSEVINQIGELQKAVEGLLKLYEQDETLNDRQPHSMQKVIPMSLDEWSIEISELKRAWSEKERYCPECNKGKMMLLKGDEFAKSLGEADNIRCDNCLIQRDLK